MYVLEYGLGRKAVAVRPRPVTAVRLPPGCVSAQLKLGSAGSGAAAMRTPAGSALLLLLAVALALLQPLPSSAYTAPAPGFNTTLTFENLCAACGLKPCPKGALLLLETQNPGNCHEMKLTPKQVFSTPTGCWVVQGGKCAEDTPVVVGSCTAKAGGFTFENATQTVASTHCPGMCAAKVSTQPIPTTN